MRAPGFRFHPVSARPGWRGLLALVAGLGLGGCSLLLSLGYQHVDTLLLWQLRGYFPLDAAQESRLRQELAAVQQWHCRTQLPRYVRWLRETVAEVRQGMPRERLAQRAAQVQAHWQELLQQLGQGMAWPLATASAEQLTALQANFRERNQEFQAAWLALPAGELADKRMQRAPEQITRWTGPLDTASLARVQAWSQSLEPTGEAWLAFRERWQAALLELLREPVRDAAWSGRVGRFVAEYPRLWSPELAARSARNRERTLDLLHELLALMDAEQRAALEQRALDYAADFERLSCETPGAPPAQGLTAP